MNPSWSLSDIRSRLDRLVRARSRAPAARLHDDAVLGLETGLDSQALVALMLDIEDEFGVELDPACVGRLAGVRLRDLPAALGLETRDGGSG